MGDKLTTKQAADRLGVNASRVRQLVIAGRLPAERFGRALVIDSADLDTLERRKPGPRAKDRAAA